MDEVLFYVADATKSFPDRTSLSRFTLPRGSPIRQVYLRPVRGLCYRIDGLPRSSW